MKQQQAFTGEHRMLKGTLHIHTTRSDGKASPEETVRRYHEQGHDFIAITDHRVYNYQNFAPEVPMTIIPGMEFDNTFERGVCGFRTFHTVCIGPERENGNGYEQEQRLESGTAKDQQEYQAYLDGFHANGNLTIHCHPQWSSTPARYFDQLQGNIAMEIWNTTCAMDCDSDNDAAYWDELLGQGKRIWGVASDDAHQVRHIGGGWVMVNSENNVSSILAALRDGKFYSSCGPQIYNFYVEDGRAVVECSPAAKIRFHCDMFPNKLIRAEEGELTRAEMVLENKNGKYRYVRAVVIDKDGKYAWTNPIFLD